MSTRPPAQLLTEETMTAYAQRAWEDAGIRVLDVTEVDEMPPHIRVEYLRSLHSWQVANGISNGPYQEYRRWEQRCRAVVDEVSGDRCRRQRWESSPHCLTHSTVDEIDPDGAEERRKAAARARAAAMTERALDELEKILTAPEEEIGPTVRMKAIESVLDRGGLPKRSESKQEVNGEVTHVVEAASIVTKRLDAIREATITRELSGIEAASATGDGGVVDAEVVSPAEDPEET